MTALSKTTSLHSNKGAILFGLAVALFAFMLTFKYFPGLENEHAYAGLAYQSIHPDAFAGDPYRDPENSRLSPIRLSLTYVLSKAVGELWLDDRFLALLYAGLVAVGLLGIDRIARLLGCSGMWERLVILLVFLKDHAVLDHKVLLAHHQGFNHTVFAIPIIVWLFYTALARKGLPVVLLLSLLLLVFSLRYAPIPVLTAMAVVAMTGKRWERYALGGLCVMGLLAAYWVLFHVMAVPDPWRLELWDILRTAAGGDVNPFHNFLGATEPFIFRNLIWLIILGTVFFLSPSGDPTFRGVRTIMLMGFLTWLLGGLYISHAPDFLKLPLLQGIAPTRALAWPQNIAYVAIFALGFRWVATESNRKKIMVTCMGFAVLFIIGPGNIDRWSILLAAGTFAVMALHWVGWPKTLTGRTAENSLETHVRKNWRLMVLQTLSIVIAIAYAATLGGKIPAWKTTLETGVFGHAAPAAWIGVAEYIRDKTPPTASVLPITYRGAPSYPEMPSSAANGRLWATRSLGTRAGRTMPVPEDFPGDFRNPDSWQQSDRQKTVIRRIEETLMNRDVSSAVAAIAALKPIPDYVILPEAVLGPSVKAIGDFRFEDRVRGYAVFKR